MSQIIFICQRLDRRVAVADMPSEAPGKNFPCLLGAFGRGVPDLQAQCQASENKIDNYFFPCYNVYIHHL
jgi:hypothetical protein